MNSMYFSKEATSRGDLTRFVTMLNSMSYNDDNTYFDIHIRPEDLGAFVVEWAQVPWSHEYGGKFVYLDEDEVVTSELTFPDGHFEYWPKEDHEEILNYWLKDNPGWEKSVDTFGFVTWRHKDD